MSASSLHPTKRMLLQTVVKLLDSKEPSDITSEEILSISGISKGSMYYHYKDFSEIIEDAICERFGWYVDRSVDLCEAALNSAKSREDLIATLKQVTRATQRGDEEDVRYARVRAIAMASGNERMRKKLGEVQERLTEALEDLFRETKECGWVSADIEPRAAAVLVQAYTFGNVVDDFTPEHMDRESWFSLIDAVVEKVLFASK